MRWIERGMMREWGEIYRGKKERILEKNGEDGWRGENKQG